MSTLSTLLAAFPNAKVTISYGPTRRKPQPGDRRYFAGKGWCIRRRQVARYPNGDAIGEVSHNGRPVYEWVAERHMSAEELASLKQLGEWFGARDVTPKNVKKPATS